MAKRNIWTLDRERTLLASLLEAQKKKQTQEQWFKALHKTDKDNKKPLGSERTYSLGKCVTNAKKLIKLAEKMTPPLKVTLPGSKG
jgi:flagellar motility protein MotE (MotC chaperone)